MSPRRRDADPGPTAPARLEEALRTRILNGESAPGSPLREEDLATEFAVSRHTVRTALAALAAQRLVDAVPYRGARVAALDDDELEALQGLRTALEAEAVRLLIATHGTRWPESVTARMRTAVARLAEAEATGDWIATTHAHAAVHTAIVDAAGSARIAEAHAGLESEILLLLTHVRPHYPEGALAGEHTAYLDALPREGGEAVRAHLAHSTELIRAARSR